MDRVIYTVEVSASRWDPWWTETATLDYGEAVARCEREVKGDPYTMVRLVEWENGKQVRWTNYGKE
jgi:hypothetical protein